MRLSITILIINIKTEEMTEQKILVTGSAGFIGYHLVSRLLQEGFTVVGLDSINNYYDTDLKYDRLQVHGIDKARIHYNRIVKSPIHTNYRFIQLRLEDRDNLSALFKNEGFDVVVNLAAQVGVRYSITNPDAYINSNLIGFYNLIECSKEFAIKHFVYASSSSVYGLSNKQPLSVSQKTDSPISLYAATKKSNELIAHSYSHLYHLPATGLRFFTVYGPWGRPDMAIYSFTQSIIENKPIKVFNNGNLERDFTYVSDVVEGIYRVILHPPYATINRAPHRVYNIGNGTPVKLLDMISGIEKTLNKNAVKEYTTNQAGDVYATHADMDDFYKEFEFKPLVPLAKGIEKFVEWFLMYINRNTFNGNTVPVPKIPVVVQANKHN
jgi:Nucleoside-diphosphate-sugar epimerases